MKIAPLVRALRADGRLAFRLVHTGQHYDREMNDVFFEELGIPQPDVRLGCGGGSHAEQTAKIMVAYEQLCQQARPAATLVVGDVNSTLACAIVAKKLCIPVAHVEAGLRSGDMTMPEEINRLVTDAISDWFFVTEPAGLAHLKREGKPDSAVFDVGHVMVDNVLYQAEKLKPWTPRAWRPTPSSARTRATPWSPCTAPAMWTALMPCVAWPACSTAWPRKCPSSLPCTRARARTSKPPASRSTRASPWWARSPIWPSCTCGRTPRWCSATAAACRRRPPRWACPA
jgi:hypothetical protein